MNLNSGYSSFYMCLYTDWDRYENGIESVMDFCDREVTMEVGIKMDKYCKNTV